MTIRIHSDVPGVQFSYNEYNKLTTVLVGGPVTIYIRRVTKRISKFSRYIRELRGYK